MTNRTKIRKKISQERAFSIIKAPVISEKSTFISQFSQYLFKVANDAAKPEIKQAIEAIFKVKVESVNVLNRPGKVKKFRGRIGQRQGHKRAFVKLAQGQTIDVGAGL